MWHPSFANNVAAVPERLGATAVDAVVAVASILSVTLVFGIVGIATGAPNWWWHLMGAAGWSAPMIPGVAEVAWRTTIGKRLLRLTVIPVGDGTAALPWLLVRWSLKNLPWVLACTAMTARVQQLHASDRIARAAFAACVLLLLVDTIVRRGRPVTLVDRLSRTRVVRSTGGRKQGFPLATPGTPVSARTDAA